MKTKICAVATILILAIGVTSCKSEKEKEREKAEKNLESLTNKDQKRMTLQQSLDAAAGKSKDNPSEKKENR